MFQKEANNQFLKAALFQTVSTITEQNQLKRIDNVNENDLVSSAKALKIKIFYHVLYYLFNLNYLFLEAFENDRKNKKEFVA